MKYLLLIYGNEAAMMSADQKAVEQMMAAYGAYSEAMKKAGVYRRRRAPAADRRCHHGARLERQDAGAERPLRRDEGAARRLLHDRRAGPRRGALLGLALPGRAVRIDRGAADLADVTTRDAAGGRSGARNRGDGGAPELRQAGRLPCGADARRRRRRGRVVRGVCGGARRLARSWCPEKPRGLAAHRRAAKAGRCGAQPKNTERSIRSCSPDRRGGGSRRGKQGRNSRRSPAAHVRLCAPRDRAGGSRAAHPSDHFGFRRSDNRLGISRRAGRDGPAAGARKNQDQARRHSVPRAGALRARRATRGGALGDLRRILGGLVRSGRARSAPAEPRGGGDMARTPRRLAAAGRAGGAWPSLPDASCRGAAWRAAKC